MHICVHLKKYVHIYEKKNNKRGNLCAYNTYNKYNKYLRKQVNRVCEYMHTIVQKNK